MRYLLFAVLAWQGLWILLMSYAVFEGVLEAARDKGWLASAWSFAAIVLIGLPGLVLAAGWLLRRLLPGRR